MRNLEFHDPWCLLLAMLAPLAYIWCARRGGYLTYSSGSLVNDLPISWRMRFGGLPAQMMGLSAIGLAVALARPRSPDTESRVRHEGIAIMMAVDRSGSMQARDLVSGDMSINRLQVAQQVLHKFVLGSPGKNLGRVDDLVGLVSFAGYADSACPLTTDHLNLVNLVEQMQIASDREEDGTAIGDALALCVERLRGSTAASRIIILLTDGVNNTGISTPQQAAELAKSYGIKIYCVGAGTEGYAPVPVQMGPDPRNVVLQREQVHIDEETLTQVAQATGGQYFRATDATTLDEIYSQIDLLERSEITETRYLQYTEHFSSVLLPSLGLIVTALLLRHSVLRTVP
ncbi:MAG: VWA domain-containing protein [Planctomycetota bacterium]|nr:VWA domain-containing protein [Planctomycetota bacterium]